MRCGVHLLLAAAACGRYCTELLTHLRQKQKNRTRGLAFGVQRMG